ncbi:MAG: GIY-YIG nuclease family protein [Pseudomonadota bacterium]
MADMTDDDILAELGVDLTPKKARSRTPREERIIAGFEDIVKFRETHGRAPQHGEGRDIFERLYAVRLDRLRALTECRELLADMDVHGLLDGSGSDSDPVEALDDSALLAELGLDAEDDGDITRLRNVRSNADRTAAEEIASSKRCADFASFRPLFDKVQADLEAGIRTTRPFVRDLGLSKAEILPGEFFIVGGQIAYVAEAGEQMRAPNGETDARLRVIYSNGTESDLLLRSLQRALYKDEGGRRITEPSAGPLFAEAPVDPDGDHLATGTLYVLRSRSDHPRVAAHRDLIHKIGITGGKVETRIAGAENDATYLLAGVDVVATYRLYDIDRPRLEGLIHRVLDDVRFEVEIPDRFGKPVRPREWFLVPLPVIDEIVARIGDGTLADYVYDRAQARLVRIEG